MKIRIRHATDYEYPRPAVLGPHVVRLRPSTHARTPLLSYNLAVRPDCDVRWQHDPWGNRVARLTFTKEVAVPTLGLVVDATFDVRPINPFDFFIDDRCEELPFTYPDGLEDELKPFLSPPALGPLGRALAEANRPGGTTIDYLVSLNQCVASTVAYVIRDDPGVQTSEQTLEVARGSCRDSAVLLVDLLRAGGLAARFASGYLIQLTDEGIIPDEARGVTHDVVDLHAWAEVYLPGAGWVGLDGTSGLLCGEGHIPLACSPEPAMAAPISGTASEPATLAFTMQIERLGHEPRPLKPYTEETWAAVERAGETVDSRIAEHGLTLTCGGEPTWTSRLHREEPEWITEALGATKWSQGRVLAAQLRGRLDAGAVMLERMGKHYPGESLPRWALHLLWRSDGVPVWRDPSLLQLAVTRDDVAIGDLASDHVTDDGDLERAAALGTAIAESLGVEARPSEAYEDPVFFADLESRLPADVDPLDVDADDPEERQWLARALRRGLGRPVGYAIPLQEQQGRWVTGTWEFRGGQLLLVPGDSPIGLRLPLDQLTGEPVLVPTPDLTAVDRPILMDPLHPPTRARAATPGSVEKETDAPHTALCIQPVKGGVAVFLPPASDTESFLELIAAAEDAAASLGVAVRLQGYGPPSDPRLRQCMVTPDPGVLEVNLPVCESTAEYLAMLGTASEAAAHAGLTTEKYHVDGREAGSGGGNHLTLGGPTTVKSPFLVRPDLVGSLLRYLQNHPALSYLFTGLFVGPTSQAPRIDEARHDSLYELELALEQIPAAGTEVFPWEVDRLLRNLLVDVAGNTHRTEVCIDKLYDPFSTSGRQGILEFRAFEMPPHERMAAVQMLLLRALVAMFAEQPYEGRLVRWGSALHDRFMLPHFLWRDMVDVATDLGAAGLPIEREWFRPFLEHRCPVAGTLEVDGVTLELRTALEPWPTLGEQPTGAAVSRYVDSSVERLQLRVTGLVDERHEIGCNGLRVPLHPTDVSGEFVAGIRFRAWQPPYCLQPRIGPHHPLRFDVVDTWGRRSLGACTYHVWHPEGRAYDAPPLTRFEAAARRAQRFTCEGHAPWPVYLEPTQPHGEQPYTLDLRRYLRDPRDGDDGAGSDA